MKCSISIIVISYDDDDMGHFLEILFSSDHK